MTVSHKRTFFENIATYDEGELAREVRRLLSANTAENRRFDMDRYRRELAHRFTPEQVDRVMVAAMKPYEGEVKKAVPIVTGADLARAARKALKTNMGSRRKAR
jgi:hypothetical protein